MPSPANQPMHRPSLGSTVLAAAIALLVLLYPATFELIVARYGARAAAGALLAYAVLLAGFRRALGFPLSLRAPGFAGLGAIVVATVVTGDPRYLRLVPALVCAVAAFVFWTSLRQPPSVIERAARLISPHAPDFIRTYCEKSTAFWCALLALNAAWIAWLAMTGRAEAWRAYTSWQMFAGMGVVWIADFFVRKWWFRYYYSDNCIDRICSQLFPAENTEMGRRSMQYIANKRQELGMPPPTDHTRSAERVSGRDRR